MSQYKDNVQNLVTNKMQELHSVTEKWKESYERAVKLVHDKQGKLCEKKCKETQKEENDKAEKFHLNQERKLKTKANEIEADLLNQALYLRSSILHELGVEQLLPTVIYEDNKGARLMTNAQQPTRRTRHVELKQFAVLQWVKDEQIIFGDIGTAYNISDSLTKQTGRTKFHQHHDLLMGRLRPTYARSTDPTLPIISKCSFSAYDYIDLYDYSKFDLDTVTSMGRW